MSDSDKDKDKDKVIIFINSISLSCPKCKTMTRYRRDGYDGSLGEGQYCDNCKKWVIQAGMQYLIVDRNNPVAVKKWKKKVKKIYENS